MRSITWYTEIDSPIGRLRLAADEYGLRRIDLPGSFETRAPPPEWQRADGRFDTVAEQLRAYFEGELKHFDLPLAPRGTAFQQRVWSRLREIPYGETISYVDLAVRIGNPQACRAVGLANGSNPIPIVIPCHRVIGRDGSLVGYGGGLALKKRLLALELAAAGFHLTPPSSGQRLIS